MARALNRILLLGDEPTGDLDPQSANGVFELMREVNKVNGTTFLMVTHNHALAERCDLIIEMVDGRIVSTGGGASTTAASSRAGEAVRTA